MRYRSFVPLSVLVVAGCVPEVDCTTEAKVSVTVSVVDFDGNPVSDATVLYSVDGADPAECDVALENGNVFLCGYEVQGLITIEAYSGGLSSVQDVQVGADDCHVIGETVEAVLRPGA